MTWPAEIRQRAAGIARVDRRIRLDRVEQGGALCLNAALSIAWLLNAPPEGTDHPLRHGRAP